MGEQQDEQKRRQDIDDLNNERAGNETGRIRRFLHERDPEFIETKKREDERKLSALMQLLQDPAYRAAYDAAWSAYEDAQDAVDQALIENAEAIERLTAYTDEMDARVHKLGNEVVFQDESGRFFRADGTPLTAEETARVERSADAPSFEARKQAGDALEAAQARRAHILEIQATVLDPARKRLEDEDNPMSESELRDLTANLDGVIHDVSLSTSAPSFARAADAGAELPVPAQDAEPLVIEPIIPLR